MSRPASVSGSASTLMDLHADAASGFTAVMFIAAPDVPPYRPDDLSAAAFECLLNSRHEFPLADLISVWPTVPAHFEVIPYCHFLGNNISHARRRLVTYTSNCLDLQRISQSIN